MSLLLDSRLKNCRCIFFDELKLSASIGIHPAEKEKKQIVNVNLEVYINKNNSSSENDDINDVLDYDQIREGITKIVSSKHFFLQETLIDEIADFCCAIKNVKMTKINISKPEAYQNCKAVGIELVKWK